MKITILCSDALHPVNEYLKSWISMNKVEHQIDLIRLKSELSHGDLLFLISCTEILSDFDRKLYLKTLVIHASDLPSGKGWSPHIWQIIEGATTLTITLLDAVDKIDSGDIWIKLKVPVSKDALYDEINQLIFDAELKLMNFAIENFETIVKEKQCSNIESSYYNKRSPHDSKINPNKSIADQFDLIRVCDPQRFPAFFELHGNKYIIRLEKVS